MDMGRILTRQDLKFYLDADRRVNLGNISFRTLLRSKIYHTEQYAAYSYLKHLRLCEYHLNNKSLLHSVLFRYYSIKKNKLGLKYHIQIPENVLGYGTRICHLSGGGGILLNANKIGNMCTFNSGVILGNRHSKTDKPWIGDNVVLCPGCQAFGEVHIEDGAYICPNATVTKDVPQNTIVAGVPAKGIGVRNK